MGIVLGRISDLRGLGLGWRYPTLRIFQWPPDGDRWDFVVGGCA